MPDSIDIRIYYEDTDCGGVVYYGKYLGFLERARTDYLEKRGIEIRKLMNEGIFFVVAGVEIRYLKPARYADVITIHTEIEKRTPISITFVHDIFLGGAGVKISTAKVMLVTVGVRPGETELRPRKMSKEIIEALKT